MNKSKHTPGPWAWAEHYDGGIYQQHCIPHTGMDNAALHKSRIALVDLPTDARLIAAAPELLALLAESLRGMTQTQYRDFEQRARAAIAKAEGK